MRTLEPLQREVSFCMVTAVTMSLLAGYQIAFSLSLSRCCERFSLLDMDDLQERREILSLSTSTRTRESINCLVKSKSIANVALCGSRPHGHHKYKWRVMSFLYLTSGAWRSRPNGWTRVISHEWAAVYSSNLLVSLRGLFFFFTLVPKITVKQSIAASSNTNHSFVTHFLQTHSHRKEETFAGPRELTFINLLSVKVNCYSINDESTVVPFTLIDHHTRDPQLFFTIYIALIPSHLWRSL